MRKIVLAIIILSIVFIPVSVLADDNLLQSGIEELDKINRESEFQIKNPKDPEAIEKVEEWAVRKQNEVIFFLQIIAQPLSIVIFIICGYITLVGSIGDNKLLISGILGMIGSIIIYAIIIYVQVIFQVFISFIST